MVQAGPQRKTKSSELKIIDVEFSPSGRKRTRRQTTIPDLESGSGNLEAEMEIDAAANAEDGSLQELGEQGQREIIPTRPQDQAVQERNSIEQHPSFVPSVNQAGFHGPDQLDFREHDEVTHVDIDVGSPDVPNSDISRTRGHYQQNEAFPSKGSSSFQPATGQHVHLIDRVTASPSFGEVQDSLADLRNVDLEVLNYLASNPSNLDLLASSPWAYSQTDMVSQAFSPGIQGSVVASSPDMYSTYYPDHTYKELHSQLHGHMVKTARNKALTRRGSVASVQHRDAPSSPHLFGLSSTQSVTTNSSAAQHIWKTLPISQKRYVELWQNYLDEIAPWLDMFDSEKNFQTTVAIMAKDVDYLQFSVLALSARQLERKNPSKTHTESLHLYQEAIKLIAAQLPSLNTEIIAACVLLCVLEMMSSSPRAWAKHLDGCAMLLEAAGVNGVVGGVKQAIFWCFARMDVWGGFLGDTITKIPTNRWFISTDSMSSAISQFKGKSGSDNYANYAVFLCASVVNVVSNEGLPWPRTAENDYSTFVSRWKALYEVLEGWYDDRAEDMRPLINLAPPQEEMDSPFNMILFSTPAGVNGNQLYHASMLLLLQVKPKEIRMPKSHKSTIWHARQLCGIAVSNDNHGALINALQPLWIAGKFMSHRSEHVAILATLDRLEKQTGWATSWRAQDLKEFWGVGESQI